MATEAQVQIIMKMIDKTSKQMNTISSASKRMGKTMTDTGKTMTRGLTLPLLAVGAASVKVATDFDKSMRNVQSMGHQSEEQLKDLGDQFKAMSMDMSQTTDTANGLAQAYFNIQSAGFAGEDGMTVLEVATKTASAGLTTTKIAAESLMGVLSSYGLQAKDTARVSDIMFQAVTKGMLTFDQLAAAMPQVTGLANAMGVSIEEVAAAFSTMSKAGVNAANAATMQTAIMSELSKGSDQLTAAAQALGFASSRAMLEQKGLAGTLQLLEQHADSTGIAVDSLFNNIRAAKGVLALTGDNAAVFAADLEAMGDSAGATQAAFAEQMKSFSAQFANFRNIVQVAMIDIGNAVMPVLVPIAQTLGKIIKAFTELPQPIQAAVVGFGMFALVLGPILTIVGMLTTAFSAVTGAIGFFTGGITAAQIAAIPTTASLSALATAIWAVAAPILPLVAAIGALILVIDQFGAEALNTVKTIGMIFEAIWNKLKEAFPGLAKAFAQIGVNIIKSLAQGLLNGAKWVIQAISDVGNFVIGGLKSVFGIASPSKVMTAVGNNLGLSMVGGFADGVSNGMNQIGPSIGRAFGGNLGFNSGSRRNSGGGMGGMGGGGSFLDRAKRVIGSPDFGQRDRDQLLAALGVSGGGAPVAAAAAGGGDMIINIDTMNLPAGTPKEQVDFIWDELANRTRKRGPFNR